MDGKRLGDYEAFRLWTGHARTWGPKGAGWRAWMGGGVIDGLCEVLDAHQQLRSRGSDASPAVVGCVPWLTSDAVVDRLASLAACCIVVDKGAYLHRRLVEEAAPFPNVLPGLRMTAPAVHGEAEVLGPSSPEPAHELGPVRVLGWRGRDHAKPLLHAKLLVLGDLEVVTIGPDDGLDREELVFTPRSVWWGSANLTRRSASHLEVATWSDDPALSEQATRFLAEVVGFSEPVGSTCVGPEPDLVEVEFDDEAMREAAYEQWLAHEAEQHDHEP